MTATSAAHSPVARPHHRRARAPRPRRAPARGQHPLDLRQAGGARLGPVQADLAAADRRSGDPGGGRGSDDRCARERRLHERARGQAADEPAGARQPDRRPRPGLRRARRRENLLARPRIQDAFVELAVLSQRQFVKVLHGDTKAVDTSNGDVVLDIRPLVLKLGDRFGFVSNLADQIPPDAGQVTILEADNLDTAQKITHWLEQIANFIWIFARRRLGRRDLAGPRATAAGGSLARHRSRRRRRDRARRALARRKVRRRSARRQRFDAAGGPQRVADHHAVARRRRLGRARRRHPRRDRRLARRPRRPRHCGARRARPAPAAARDRVERVRRRDVADHLAPPDPGLPDDGRARRRGCDRLRRLPAPARGGVAGACARALPDRPLRHRPDGPS